MLKRENGFTLVEMLIAMSLGLMLSFASFALIEAVMKRSGEISSRVETTQRARVAMDDITRSLRSQVCVTRSDPTLMTGPRSIYAATASSVTFFADTADESWKTGVTAMPVETLRTLALTGSAQSGNLVETLRQGVDDASTPGVDAVSFAAGTDRTRRILSDLDLVPDPVTAVDIPIFRYYAFDLTKTPPTPTLPMDPGAGSLTDAQLASIARIAVSFRVLPSGRIAQPGYPIPRGSAVLQGDVYVRTADPNSSTPKPTCL